MLVFLNSEGLLPQRRSQRGLRENQPRAMIELGACDKKVSERPESRARRSLEGYFRDSGSFLKPKQASYDQSLGHFHEIGRQRCRPPEASKTQGVVRGVVSRHPRCAAVPQCERMLRDSPEAKPRGSGSSARQKGGCLARACSLCYLGITTKREARNRDE